MQGETNTKHLSSEEFEILRWLLPAERPGYDTYFRAINELTLLGNGRWGPGDYIFGQPGDSIDLSGSMERVYAFGNIFHADASCSISVHENVTGQIEVQFARTGGRFPCMLGGATARYCYSYWQPSDSAPKSNTMVRQVDIHQDAGIVLAISPGDERVWLHEATTGVNHLIPHMKFHNELMRQSGIRIKEDVFNPKLLLQEDARFDDSLLRATFAAYNNKWTKVDLPAPDDTPPKGRKGFFQRFFNRM